jgi:hypothetical protein
MAGTRWGKFSWVAMLVAILVAVGSVSASEARAAGEPDTGGYGAFTSKASNGYWMLVIAGSEPEYRNGYVLIWLSRTGRAAFYSAPATVTDTRIEAELGRLGRIAVEFKGSGLKGKLRSPCDPSDRVTYDRGSYVGTIDFRGEEEYAKASATSAPFSIKPFIAFACAGSGTGETFGAGLPGARLVAWARTRQGRIRMQVNQNRPGARVHVEALAEERRGEIQIAREVRLTSPGAALEFAPDLRFAALRPIAPFSGTGTFRRGAERANRWTGSLAVDFPGRSNVSLTGDRFHVSLVHASRTKKIFQPLALKLPKPR